MLTDCVVATIPVAMLNPGTDPSCATVWAASCSAIVMLALLVAVLLACVAIVACNAALLVAVFAVLDCNAKYTVSVDMLLDWLAVLVLIAPDTGAVRFAALVAALAVFVASCSAITNAAAEVLADDAPCVMGVATTSDADDVAALAALANTAVAMPMLALDAAALAVIVLADRPILIAADEPLCDDVMVADCIATAKPAALVAALLVLVAICSVLAASASHTRRCGA